MEQKNCETCRYFLSEPPHTCDMCTSLDNTEDYSGWKERIAETSSVWIPTKEQLPLNNGIYLVSIYDTNTHKDVVKVLYWDKYRFRTVSRGDISENWYPEAYCLLKEPYRT